MTKESQPQFIVAGYLIFQRCTTMGHSADNIIHLCPHFDHVTSSLNQYIGFLPIAKGSTSFLPYIQSHLLFSLLICLFSYPEITFDFQDRSSSPPPSWVLELFWITFKASLTSVCVCGKWCKSHKCSLHQLNCSVLSSLALRKGILFSGLSLIFSF